MNTFATMQLAALIVCLLAGSAAVATVSLAANGERGAVTGVLALLALAALAAGGFFGFLFGVPRTATTDPTERYRANTNIEKISDWLTTALIGATLVQLGSIRQALGALFADVATQLGDGIEPVVPGSVVVYFAILGFFLGWLTTRLYLHRAMNAADALASIREKYEELDAQASLAEEVGDQQKAANLRSKQAELLGTLATLDAEYGTLRAGMPPGLDRTAKLSRLVEQMKDSAAHLAWTPAAVSDVYARGDAGRVQALALMQRRPDLVRPDLLARSIRDSKSAFEQHIALEAVLEAIGVLDESARTDLVAEIRAQMQPGQFITPETHRYLLALQILRRIEAE